MSIVFDHVNIVVDDLEATRAFFVDTFGFTSGTPLTLEGAWVDELNGYKNAKATYVPLAPPAGGSTGSSWTCCGRCVVLLTNLV